MMDFFQFDLLYGSITVEGTQHPCSGLPEARSIADKIALGLAMRDPLLIGFGHAVCVTKEDGEEAYRACLDLIAKRLTN